MSPINISNELAKVYDWLVVNKLFSNIKKRMILYAINETIEGVVSDLTFNDIPLERVQNFNILSLLLNENLS